MAYGGAMAIDQCQEEGILERLRTVLAGGGLRLTQQRLSIYRALEASSAHPSCEDLFQSLRPSMPSLSIDTVYRTVGTLEQAGMIRKLVSLDGVQRYDANLAHHHHFVCERCLGVSDIVWDAFDSFPVPESLAKWGTVRSCQVEFRGVCVKCEAPDRMSGA